MDDPLTEIPHAITACAAAPSPSLQSAAITRYFTPDAAFIHPLCYIPSSPTPSATTAPYSRTTAPYSRTTAPYNRTNVPYSRASTPCSRDDIIATYKFYRSMIPFTHFEITSTAFDEQNGKLYVDLIQRPWVRGVTWLTGWRPKVVMHVHFWLWRDVDGNGDGGGKWRICKQEDTIQLMEFLRAWPGVGEGAVGVWWCMGMVGRCVGWALGGLGVWWDGKSEVERR